MAPRRRFDGTARWLLLLLAGAMICVFGPAAAPAAVIVSVQSVTAAAGSSGNALDVELTNSGPGALVIGAFTFGIVTANSHISFTDAGTQTTAAYIFGANSSFGPDLTGATSGQSLIASDVFNIPSSGASLSSGSTVGLGRLLFDVSPLAVAGTFPVDLKIFPVTTLSDQVGGAINIDSFLPGEITISGAVGIPEPSSLLMLFAGAIVIGRRGLRYRRAIRGN